MTREEAIANLKMISVAFVEPVTKEQRKLIDDTFNMAIEALETKSDTDYKTLLIKLENAEDVIRGLKEDLREAREELRQRW